MNFLTAYLLTVYTLVHRGIGEGGFGFGSLSHLETRELTGVIVRRLE